jgi:hypothetical protein
LAGFLHHLQFSVGRLDDKFLTVPERIIRAAFVCRATGNTDLAKPGGAGVLEHRSSHDLPA